MKLLFSGSHIDYWISGTRRRSIYGYHRVSVDLEQVKNHTAVIITPKPCKFKNMNWSFVSIYPYWLVWYVVLFDKNYLFRIGESVWILNLLFDFYSPACISLRNCTQCLTAEIGFSCRWCGAVGRCSDGMDRMRQDWIHNKCHLTVSFMQLSYVFLQHSVRTRPWVVMIFI